MSFFGINLNSFKVAILLQILERFLHAQNAFLCCQKENKRPPSLPNPPQKIRQLNRWKFEVGCWFFFSPRLIYLRSLPWGGLLHSCMTACACSYGWRNNHPGMRRWWDVSLMLEMAYVILNWFWNCSVKLLYLNVIASIYSYSLSESTTAKKQGKEFSYTNTVVMKTIPL